MVRERLKGLMRMHSQPPGAIRRMRLKLIGAAMGATTLVLVMILVGMNVMNWRNMCKDIDDVVDLIEEAGGALATLDFNDDDLSVSSSIGWEALQEIPYDARYFTVTFGTPGEEAHADLSSIASVNEQAAQAMAQDVIGSTDPRGFYGNYRYRIVHTEQGTMVIFLYCYDNLSSFRSVMNASILMGLLGLAAFAAIVVPFSIVATRPVEEARERQRRFVTDASHELRTPLSIIGSATDVIEIESGESEWTQSIHNQTKRLEDLANKLVSLAKADEGSHSLALEDVDVSSVALEVAEGFESVAQAQGKPLDCSIARDVRCRADRGMVEQMMTILLDNAFKHSSDGAHVRFELSATDTTAGGGHALFMVSNDAEGLAPGAHPELFRRFYRADDARKYSGSHGIGLSVVQAGAEAHGGTATAQSDGAHLTVEVRI